MFINVCSELKKVNKCIVFLINVIQIVLISDIKYIMCNGHTNIMSSICGNEGQSGANIIDNTQSGLSYLNPYLERTALVKPPHTQYKEPYISDRELLRHLNRL